MRCKAAKQTMAAEPESLPCSLAGLERHVGHSADTEGRRPQYWELCCKEGPQEEPEIQAKPERETDRDREREGERVRVGGDKHQTTLVVVRASAEVIVKA